MSFEMMSSVVRVLLGKTDSSANGFTYGLLFSIGVYVTAPTVLSLIGFGAKFTEDSDNKRMDKYTPGLSNPANECFINSSLQALSSLDYLTAYLHDALLLLSPEEEDVEKNEGTGVLLTRSLSDIVGQLQTVTCAPQTLSNKQFVRSLERIFRGRMSRTQNDAHEFTQLLVDTLESENVTVLAPLCDETALKFPFEGETTSFSVCLKCKQYSEVSAQKFLIHELVVPKKSDAHLEDILTDGDSELIEDYSCLYCQITAILTNESNTTKPPTGFEAEMVGSLQSLLPDLKINTALPDTLLDYVKSYRKGNCNTSILKTAIIRRTAISNAPSILSLHLSRSMFNGASFTRNPCRVEYPETLIVLQRDVENGTAERITYRLRSMIKHTGTHYSGHYQCYKHKPDLVKLMGTGVTVNRSPTVLARPPMIQERVKTPKSVRRWPYWFISDAVVRESNAGKMLRESKYVYMLFYERVL
ncbi:putative ubiquitin-specific protease UBP16 KNAG_0A01970 [Huiozyma naganishii CBS 8797]|uniref:Ubiquitin carboxyl-terminal hydrolase n=1 Tax=Huiozyma naganishii (strain ATCC MYA-139 / BCRC 22969 / CBS 8797 / KCTC 17520 / NBRC 10181 / NCYC 3082 / Yp74L-3) TaxID=1071383 RepID=J7S3A1_HUIN7|nr:hypothetical protein KNAG_0A01970 [Kazachstania naganishii CBS 8797]CCK67886.1 hypothetical protein KNAG_0A01970 [Kazachstania naganishii CBS 8797]